MRTSLVFSRQAGTRK